MAGSSADAANGKPLLSEAGTSLQENNRRILSFSKAVGGSGCGPACSATRWMPGGVEVGRTCAATCRVGVLVRRAARLTANRTDRASTVAIFFNGNAPLLRSATLV